MFGSRKLIFIIFSSGILLLLLHLTVGKDVLSRQKRFLIWPQPGVRKIQVITGVGIPVDLQLETVIVSIVMKANYNVPGNASDITNPDIIYARKRRSTSRWDIYKMLAQLSEMKGFGGRECVLRAICEVADAPLDEDSSLIAEMFHTTFRPTSTDEELSHHSDNQYFAAQRLGEEHHGKCAIFYPNCSNSFIHLFTEFV